VGLEESPEYLIWVLLDEAGESVRLEHYDFEWDHRNPSKILAGSFEPCAVFNVWYDSGLAAKYAQQLNGDIHEFGAVYVIMPKG
jgi:hypothetical protein